MGWLRIWKRKRLLARHSLDDKMWRRVSARLPFLAGLSEEEIRRLKEMAIVFLAEKQLSPVRGALLSEDDRLSIALQACLPVLELGIEWYDGWTEVIVYPSQFAPEREIVDEDGIVHLTQDPMAGEAWLGGPVVLSYEDVAMTGDEAARVAGYNVVIHEFAHKLDMRHGEPNGFPPLHAGMSSVAWRKAFTGAYEDFCQLVDEADALAERDDGEALDTLPIDPYGAESPGEFFAVVSEAFFETPELLEPTYPAVYEQLRLFYRQDPLARLGAAGG